MTAAVSSRTRTRAIGWGVAIGVAQAGLAFAFWWLEPAVVHAAMIALIVAVYVGFAVSDGRPNVIATEILVVTAFFIAAAVSIEVTPWSLVAIYLAHGAKDLWQHRYQFVRGTRWWPPFCCAVDVSVASTIAVQIVLGARFQS
jgi:hypothetical protein